MTPPDDTEPTMRELMQIFIDRSGYDQRHTELLDRVARNESRLDTLEKVVATRDERLLTARQLAGAAVTIAFAALSLTVTTLLLLVNHILHP